MLERIGPRTEKDRARDRVVGYAIGKGIER